MTFKRVLTPSSTGDTLFPIGVLTSGFGAIVSDGVCLAGRSTIGMGGTLGTGTGTGPVKLTFVCAGEVCF